MDDKLVVGLPKALIEDILNILQELPYKQVHQVLSEMKRSAVNVELQGKEAKLKEVK